ncbi:clustered mitochondria protein [Glycine max]|uniref:clustered mitochondria protein n=1 Tax=Glycine max TaxID=3847 RepID=UPI001B35632A|nr:clustered mitochondria protein-like [Glycine max]
MEDISGLLSNVLPSSLKDVKCVESILFSSFNPPPRYRRLVEDSFYLDVTTLEGNVFCITGSTRMFYVNSCTTKTFDPRPSKATLEATTLATLLQKISPRFKKAFHEIWEQKAAAHCFEKEQPVLMPNLWLGSYPVPGEPSLEICFISVIFSILYIIVTCAPGVG